MIIDERTYTLHPGKIPEFLELYQAEGYAVQTSHLGEPVGWFWTEIGVLNQIVHLWGYEIARNAAPAWPLIRNGRPISRRLHLISVRCRTAFSFRPPSHR